MTGSIRQGAGVRAVCIASLKDRTAIYRLRHDVFASELGQHATQPDGLLTDKLDEFNSYFVVKRDGEISAFISITPPSPHGYSIDKYVARNEIPVLIDDNTYEARLLTVKGGYRGSGDALLVIYAAYTWVKSRGGTKIIGMGRREVLPMYQRFGFSVTGLQIISGAVDYEVITATIDEISDAELEHRDSLARALAEVEWNLSVPPSILPLLPERQLR